MGTGKYRIDRDTRTLLLKYIRKYGEYRTWLQAERERIYHPGSGALDGMPRGNETSDKTANAAEMLERLERSHRAKVVRVIDGAKELIGAEIADNTQRNTMKRAIWLSCLNGREYNFDAFAGLVACERRAFYNYKNEFLNRVKTGLGL